ncbi:MAG: hypothetical protein K0Q89_858, partial [Thermomicrobiales bacterium]|nr:hypothetical protein [Thermomicrobiales bacterium]
MLTQRDGSSQSWPRSVLMPQYAECRTCSNVS